MGRLRPALALLAILALVTAAPAGAADLDGPWRAYVSEASVRFGIPKRWIDRVLTIESGGRVSLAGRPIRSPKGAMGLMQLMPDTWREMRTVYGLGNDPDDPRDNILAGAAYLRLMYDRFGYPGCFAAYNAGPARYSAYLGGAATLPRETANYVSRAADESTSGEVPERRRDVPPSVFAIDRATASGDGGREPSPAVERAGALLVIHRD